MKTGPIRPGALQRNAEGLPFAPDFGDVYHPRAGALAQATHVFLQGNGLPGRWAGRERFTVLETGFGLGNNFLATWDLWRRTPGSCERLHYVSIEKHPLRRDDLAAAHAGSPLADMARQLVERWPLPTPNLHRLAFDAGRVQLLLAFGDVQAWVPEIVADVDAFFLDGFSPAKNPPMWDRRLLKGLARLAAPGATAATWSVAQDVREGLSEAGFEVAKAPGFGGKREISVARFAPRFVPRRAPARIARPHAAERHAVVVGAGLAGAAAAWALAEQGWSSTLLDRHSAPARETSGNAAGLFHGIVNAQDGMHARFNRAAALEVQHFMRQAVTQGSVVGAVDGVLRLETTGMDATAMQAVADALGLPPEYLQALSPGQAAARSGLPAAHPAWFYPGGGWVVPATLAQAFIAQAGPAVHFRGGVEVAVLEAGGAGWRLRDAGGRLIEAAPVVVLANAGDALRLLGRPPWPLQRVRGQTTGVRADEPGLVAPRVPVAGAGYVLPPLNGTVWCGSTAHVDDAEPALRAADHAANLAQLGRLGAWRGGSPAMPLQGRVGWRLAAGDRLPLLGAVPDAALLSQPGRRLDQPRFVPRAPGLFVCTALGARGITWAALCGRVLASLISGAPCPLEAELLDAADVARFASRQARRAP